jgi:uncharacterized protein (TIGR00297 family)
VARSPESSETGRQIVHILAGAPALLLRWLVWWQAALLAVLAIVFNLVVLPRLSRRVFRPGDLARPVASGIVLYPLAILGLILCFPSRLDIVAIAWAILAAGDGFATLVGRSLRTPALPWNREKSFGGLVAFVVFGGIVGTLAGFWTRGVFFGASWSFFLLVVPAVAAVVAGLVETAPIRLNDNLTVPATAGLVLWSFTFVEEDAVRAAIASARSALGPALVLNLAVAAAGYVARTVTVPGAIVGAGIGVAVFVGAGLAGWLLLFAAFLFAAAVTRLGFRRKLAAGIAEARGGRRGAGNALANTGLAAWAAGIALGMADPSLARLAMVAALVTGASDTVASEAGKAWGKTTWLLVGFRRVEPGTTGAVSLEGTLAGVVSASALAALAAGLGLIPAAWIAVVVAAATMASIAEGVLGATFERDGTLNNDALNFINAAIGAGLALWYVGLGSP